MDFDKLIEDDMTAEWAKELIQRLSPYPYLADFLAIVVAFACGALVSLLLFLLLRPILHRFYRRHCTMNTELLVCIRKMIVSCVGCLPLICINYSVWCDGIHEWVAILICKPLWGAALAGRPFKLDFAMPRGDFFAFWVGKDAKGASGGYVAAGGPAYASARDI